MDKSAFISGLNRAFSQNGISRMLTRDAGEKFFLMTERLIAENEKYNLTAIREPEKIIYLHLVDCALLSPFIPKGAAVIDIGCGAGFPSLPLAILRDDIKICALDATAKRTAYVAETAAMLGLENLTVVTGRAEDVVANMRGSFDIAVSRAVAEMRIMSELALPFVRVGGQLLAMKGSRGKYELSDAKRAIAILGGRGGECLDIKISAPGEVIEHTVIRVKKETKTPAGYPRAYAQISKKPL